MKGLLCVCLAKRHWLSLAAMVLMKASRGRRGGNKEPKKRQPFPDVGQEPLDNALHTYTRSMGLREAFNMYQYKHLQPQQAESPQSIAQLAKLLDKLLTVSGKAQIKYKALKQSFTFLLQTWGTQLLKAHWDIEENLLAGRAADSIGVLLKHWRRCCSSEAAWNKLVSKLDEADSMALERLRKKSTGGSPAKKRKLEQHISEVSMDSQGFPNMTALSNASEEFEEEAEEEEGEVDEAESLGNVTQESPPPCLKADWKAQAMKKPAASGMKKPASSKSDDGLAVGPEKGAPKVPAKGISCMSTEKVQIHQGTISMGGGRNQSYLQHQPGPGKNKRLIAAITLSQASRTTKTKEQLLKLLLPSCKKPGATKADVLAERAKLFKQFAK